MNKLLLYILFILVSLSTVSFAQITSSASGNWSLGSTWTGGVVPSATSNVVIAAGHTITIDPAAAVCKDLTVNAGGLLKFRNDGTAAGITVNGNLVVNGNTTSKGTYGRFICDSLAAPSAGFVSHKLTLYGNLTVNAGVDSSGCINFRMGSNSLFTSAGCDMTLAGESTTVINLQKTTYIPKFELFNAITINKTGGAKVLLSGGNLYMSSNGTTGPASLTFISGMVETGLTNIWVLLSSSSSVLSTASNTMYVNGNLGRGLGSGTNSNRIFDVGDSKGYRVLKVYNALATGSDEYLVVRCVSGNANNGASTFVGDIDKVSSVRYWKINYYSNGGGTPEVEINRLYAYYGDDDGVAAGNTDLRLAFSNDERATWNGGITGSHTTAIPAPGGAPTEMRTNNPFVPSVKLNDSTKSMYVALARLTGTTTNTLGTGTSVEQVEGLPTTFALSQNYPNPFNPTTSISFSLPYSSFVSLRVYDILGKEVENLVNEQKDAGNYKVSFDASKLSTGVYIYTLSAADYVISKKMMLIK